MQYALDLSQRWKSGRAVFVPPESVVDLRELGAEEVTLAEAAAFLAENHYLRTTPAVAVLCVGLYRRTGVAPSRLCGVAVFGMAGATSPPRAMSGLGLDARVELVRFALTPEIAFNGETAFAAMARRALAEMRPGLDAVIARSDPHPRTDVAGRVTHPGHVGQIYAASNAAYLGQSGARTIYLCRDGTVLPDRGFSKIRGEKPGGRQAMQRLVAAGAPARRFGEAPAEWLARALASPAFRRQYHPGVHTYAIPMSRKVRARMRGSLPVLPYPRKEA